MMSFHDDWHKAVNELTHRQMSARIVKQEADIRADLVARVRVAIKDVDDYCGDGDLFTRMSEAAVDTFAAYVRENQR